MRSCHDDFLTSSDVDLCKAFINSSLYKKRITLESFCERKGHEYKTFGSIIVYHNAKLDSEGKVEVIYIPKVTFWTVAGLYQDFCLLLQDEGEYRAAMEKLETLSIQTSEKGLFYERRPES